MRTFFTADQHYGHASIIRHANRIDPSTGSQFTDVNRHDAHMIDLHNAVVGPKDRVIMVGDFAYKCEPRRLKAILSRLNGQKFLVIGNHDDSATLSLPWAAPSQHLLNVSVDGQRIVCCHYGMRTWPGAARGAVHFYCHSHGRLPGNSRSLDVGVDCWDYRPVELAEIKLRLATLPPSTDVEGDPEPDSNNGGMKP
jgi:calcineurin-like phosphoesterase family protein